MSDLKNVTGNAPAHGAALNSAALNSATVVQCPACQTKFMVQALSLSGIDFPRFHCSRCDHVFTVELRELRPLEQTVAPHVEVPHVATPATLSDEAGNDNSSVGLEIPRTVSEREFAIEMPPLVGHTDDFAPVAGGGEERFRADVVEADPLEPIADADLPEEIAPRESGLQSPDYRLRDQSARHSGIGLAAQVQVEAIPDRAKQVNLPIGGGQLNLKSASMAASPSGALPPRNPTQISFDFSTAGKSAPIDRPGSEQYRASRGLSQVSRVLFSGSRWGSFFALSSPVVMTLALVVGAGFILERSAPGDVRLAQVLFPHAPVTAPEELVIDQTRYRVVELNNGERVPVVSGSLTNNSETEFREVILEGLAFDANGLLVGSTKVSAAANLARAKIKSFDAAMIENLQRERESQLFRLKPGETQSFSFAILHMPVKAAHYFAARVYSVKE